MSLNNPKYGIIFPMFLNNKRITDSQQLTAEKFDREDSFEFSCGSSIEKSPKSFNTERGRKCRNVHTNMAVSSCALGSVFGDTVYGAFGGTASFFQKTIKKELSFSSKQLETQNGYSVLQMS